MDLIKINNKILNLEHVVEINLGTHELTIEKLASKMTISIGNENNGLNLVSSEFEELKNHLIDLCCYTFGISVKEEKQKPGTLVKDTLSSFERPPDSILNRSDISDDHIDKIAQSLPPVEKVKKKRVMKPKVKKENNKITQEILDDLGETINV